MTTDRRMAAVLAASAVAAVTVVVAGVATPIRPVVALWFLLVCPGMAFVRLAGLPDRLSRWVLAISLSIALATGVALAMVLADAWSPAGGVVILAGLTFVGLLLPVLDVRPVLSVAARTRQRIARVRWRPNRDWGADRYRVRLRLLLAANAAIAAVGLAPLARRVLWWLRGRERGERVAHQIVPVVRAAVPPLGDLPPPDSWVAQRALPTVTDRQVILLGPRGQAPVAVAKIEPLRKDAGDRLSDETEILRALRADRRLDGWCGLLPEVLAEGEADDIAWRVERMLPGIPGTRFLATPGRPLRLQSLAADAVGELHRRTAAAARIGPEVIEAVIDDPLARLAATSDGGRSWDPYRPAIERLRVELTDALAGRTLAMSRIHGDFWPGNILVSNDGATVTGIIDWDLAEPSGLPLFDLMHLLLTMRMIDRRQELGVVVRSLLTDGQWTRHEREVLGASWRSLPGDDVGLRQAMLLAWLRHVDVTRTKTQRFGGPLLWEAQNIEQVLQVL